MHRTTKLVTALGALAIVVGACGAGASPSAAPATEAPSAEAPTATPAPVYPTGDFKIRLWTKEGEADGSFQFVKKLTDAYTALHPNVTFEVVEQGRRDPPRGLPDGQPRGRRRPSSCGPSPTTSARSPRPT